MSLQNLKTETAQRLLLLRAIDRLIKSEEFEYYYEQTLNKEFVRDLIINFDKKGLMNWLKMARNNQLDTMPLMCLRKIARENYVPDWKISSREKLIQSLNNE